MKIRYFIALILAVVVVGSLAFIKDESPDRSPKVIQTPSTTVLPITT